VTLQPEVRTLTQAMAQPSDSTPPAVRHDMPTMATSIRLPWGSSSSSAPFIRSIWGWGCWMPFGFTSACKELFATMMNLDCLRVVSFGNIEDGQVKKGKQTAKDACRLSSQTLLLAALMSFNRKISLCQAPYFLHYQQRPTSRRLYQLTLRPPVHKSTSISKGRNMP
jgi:hypothetical protein